jgi:protein-S-isoprenylcysteine O-methyltransferase Ste14
MKSLLLALRSLLWVVLLPGMFAGVVPWRYFGLSRVRVSWDDPRQIVALLIVGTGVLLLAGCVYEFARRGRGTLSPVDPPRRLVVRGLYRYVRNPMYLAVTLILLGESLLIPSRDLLLYLALLLIPINLFVMGYEEPYLRHRFGAEYEDYCRRVGRWIPSRPTERS